MEVKLYCPENLDIDLVMRCYPVSGIKRDLLLYIIHSIMITRAYFDDERSYKLGKRRGFIPLNAKILESKVPKYKQYLEYLKHVGIIECDESYISEPLSKKYKNKNVVSKGYRFKEPYCSSDFKRVHINDFVLCKKIKADRYLKNPNESAKSHPYLFKWFAQKKLQMDEMPAYQWVNEHEAEQLNNINNTLLLKDRKLEKKAILIEKCKNFKILISRLAEQDYYFSIDGTGNRLHTNLTNLPRELRNYITYDGQELVSIDIKNSQPYMSLLLFDKKFWKKDDKTGNPTMYKLDKTTYIKMNNNNTLHNTIMFVDSSKTLANTDIQKLKFSKHVLNGTIYEYLISVFEQNGYQSLGILHEEKRNRIKQIVFTLLFDDDTLSYNRKPGSPMQVFGRLFPTISRVFANIKEGDHRSLAIILQRIESFLLLTKVCKRISKEKPNIPLFTIHDSIITTVGNENYVQSVMEDELKKVMGAPPKFKKEYWQPENAHAV